MISAISQTRSVPWDQLSRTERFLLPGLKPGAESPSLAWEKVGSFAKLFIPTLILAGGLGNPRGSLLQMTGMNLLAATLIYSDIQLHGKLRLFEIGSGMMVPIALFSGWKAIGSLMQMGMIFKVLPPHPMMIAFTGIQSIPPLSTLGHAANLLASAGGLWLFHKFRSDLPLGSLCLWALPLAPTFINDSLSQRIALLAISVGSPLLMIRWENNDELRRDLYALSFGTVMAGLFYYSRSNPC